MISLKSIFLSGYKNLYKAYMLDKSSQCNKKYGKNENVSEYFLFPSSIIQKCIFSACLPTYAIHTLI